MMSMIVMNKMLVAVHGEVGVGLTATTPPPPAQPRPPM